jgi:hypothetical protein
MKRVINYLIILILGLNCIQAQNVISVPPDVIEFDGNNYNIQPGDIIEVQSCTKQYLRFKNIEGDIYNPIRIVNVGGKVVINSNHHFGLVLDNCKYVRFEGNGDIMHQYGFEVSGMNGNGFGIGQGSTDIEVAYVEIHDVLYVGLMAKTDPYPDANCNFEYTRDKFTMYNVNIHNLRIYNCGTEGMYIGSSKYTGHPFGDPCNTTVLPHVIEGIRVYNNTIFNTGWDGIQVSSATKNCNIYNNNILNDSQEGAETQMSGILLGGGSKCDCFNNRIFDGKGSGIEVFGLGDFMIYNNLIVNPGQTYYPNDMTKAKYGIYCKDIESTTIPNSSIHFFNNTIINPKSEGIHYRNNLTTNNQVINNCIINPGSYGTIGEQAYVKAEPANIVMNLEKNYFSLDIEGARFDDPENGNYDLALYSPLINAGKDLSAYGVQIDLKSRLRPYSYAYDIGAYESYKTGISINENEGNPDFEVFPSPFQDKFYISGDFDSTIIVKIFNLDGAKVYEEKIDSLHQFKNQLIIHPYVTPGIYIVNIVSGDKSEFQKIVCVN